MLLSKQYHACLSSNSRDFYVRTVGPRAAGFNPLTPTVAMATSLQLWSIVCQTGLSRSIVIFDIRALCRSGLKITNDDFAWSGTGCFIAAVPIWQQWASKGKRLLSSACVSLCVCLSECLRHFDAKYLETKRFKGSYRDPIGKCLRCVDW